MVEVYWGCLGVLLRICWEYIGDMLNLYWVCQTIIEFKFSLPWKWKQLNAKMWKPRKSSSGSVVKWPPGREREQSWARSRKLKKYISDSVCQAATMAQTGSPLLSRPPLPSSYTYVWLFQKLVLIGAILTCLKDSIFQKKLEDRVLTGTLISPAFETISYLEPSRDPDASAICRTSFWWAPTSSWPPCESLQRVLTSLWRVPNLCWVSHKSYSHEFWFPKIHQSYVFLSFLIWLAIKQCLYLAAPHVDWQGIFSLFSYVTRNLRCFM